MTAPSDRTPTAQGSLQETPFCHILVYVYRRSNSSGTLLLRSEPGEAKVRIARGRATMARVPWPARQLFDALLPLCGLRTGVFTFYDEDRLTGDEGTIAGNVDPYALIGASLEKYPREDAIDNVLGRYHGTRLRMPPNRELERLRLDARDTPFIELIRAAPATLEELLAQSPLPRPRTRRVLYALVITQMVVPHDELTQNTVRTQSVATISREIPQSNIGPTRRSSPAWRVLASMRPDLSMRMDSGSLRPPEAPASTPTGRTSPPAGGVTLRPSAAPYRARTPAPFSNAGATARPPPRGSTPAPFPPNLPTVRPSAPAPRSSSMPAPSHNAPTIRPTGAVQGGTPAPIPSVSGRPSAPAPTPSGVPGPSSLAPDDIPGRIRRVEGLMARTRYDDALAEIDALLEMEPERAELHGLRAQALFDKHSGDAGLPRSIIDALKRALEIDPDQTRALYTRGLVCKRGGDLRKAVTYFKRVLQVDPKHLDAQREIRLAKLRE